MTKNLTSGYPLKLILLFALPLIVGNIFQQFYNMADTLIVGRTIGVTALAAVGCTGSLIWFITGFIGGFTSGLAIITAREFGAENHEQVKVSFAASIILAVAFATVLTICAIPLSHYGLQILHTPADVIGEAHKYLSVIYFGLFATMLFNLMSCVMRALGNSRAPLIFLVVACLINIVLDLVFILIFRMGVAGAALATILAQLFSGLCCVVYVYKYMPELHVTWQHFRMVSWKYLKEHLLIAFPIGFQNSIIAIGGLILQNGLNSLGSTAIAAYVAAQKLDALATLPAGSLGIAVTTYVAQNYGAQKYNRIRQGIRQCAILSISYSVFVGALMLTFGGQLASLFLGNESAEVLAYAKTLLSISGLAYWALYLLFVYRSALQGLGHKVIPTVAGIMELIMRASSGLFLIRAFGFRGACFANPLAWFGSFVPLVFTYYYTIKKIPCD